MTISINEHPYLSICIPTYNRSAKIAETVNYILNNYSGSEIEIVLLDNCSTDDTQKRIKEIRDPRLRYFRNDENIGGTINPVKVMTLARGTFSLLCLDKDRIVTSYINRMIQKLKEADDIIFGHCNLSSKEDTNDQVFNKGYESLHFMSYLSEHPTGLFYKSEIFKNLPIVQSILKERKQFGFYFDLINAEMSMLGNSKLVNLPFVHTETKEESEKVKSFTYSKRDVFFSPKQRLIELSKYLESMSSKKLLKENLEAIVKKIYYKSFNDATIGYRSIMGDEKLCSHYGIESKVVSKFDLLRIGFWYSFKFITLTSPISFKSRFLISAKYQYRFLKVLMSS